MTTSENTSIVITSNGSKFAGSDPDTLDVLFMRLETEVLDSRFYPFAHAGKSSGTYARVHFFGNFKTYSHVFDITTDDAALIARLIEAIKRNEGYKQGRAFAK